ncbi:hypothetical protein ACIQU5_27905 [Streptomyces sp. NPDC090306]|uniref:hypothetical protein n=1 Tax=Streptomyces sp. NPDC090306 TaxID=3365961 RepID=UPI00380A4D7F
MGHQPFPNRVRAQHQIDRAVGAWSPGTVICTAGMDAALRNAEAAYLALHADRPRQWGRQSIISAIVDEALAGGDVVHVATRRGPRCTGGPEHGCGLPPVRATPPVLLARVVRTTSWPPQWNAWTTTGQYLYLCYRCGIGTVDAYDTPDHTQWTQVPDGLTAGFDTGDDWDSEMTLTEFCRRTGLQLADGAEVSGE